MTEERIAELREIKRRLGQMGFGKVSLYVGECLYEIESIQRENSELRGKVESLEREINARNQ